MTYEEGSVTTATLDRDEIATAGKPGTDDGPRETFESRFGPIPLNADRQIVVPGGLPGFPGHELFQLEQPPGVNTELLLLQAVESPDVGFFVMSVSEPTSILHLEDVAAAAQVLEIEADNLLVFLIVTFQRTPGGFRKYVNLRAPIFVDVDARRAMQLVLPNPDYSLKFELD
ncbi:MAG: flagellar assembly protein FliW [Geminicoccaceae bacterium]|nr:flagellar assembly protein FliW [Geminicoccaceae bacterium]MCB9945101.1 flagellar assembly protein FliW [Geminicoccaceae bacterium]